MSSSSNSTLITTSLVIVSVIFPLLAIVAVVLRFWARHKSGQKPNPSDWWMLAGCILSVLPCVDVWVFAGLSGVDYFKDDPMKGLQYQLLCLVLSGIVQTPSLVVVKIAILLFYKNLFPSRKMRFAVFTLIPLITIWGIIMIFLIIFQSDPVSSSWEGGGRLRYNAEDVELARIGSSIGFDILILCLPIPVIHRLQMKSSRKVAVVLIFWLGAFCCVAAVVRYIFFKRVTQTFLSSENSGYNLVGLETTNFIFLVIEPCASVIAGCLPCYGPLIQGSSFRLTLMTGLRSLLSSARRTKSTQSNYATGVTDNDGTYRRFGSKDQDMETLAGSESKVIALRTIDIDQERARGSSKVSDDNSITVTHTVDVNSGTYSRIY